MNKRRFYDTRRSNQVFTGLLLGGILFVLISTLFSYQTRRSEIEQNALTELNRIKNTCQKYDDYELGILKKSFTAAILWILISTT